jgi:hypothetical protein|tara:strand:+ start:286 stop:729 length:444 start_codon:yes stop_codon:yes gene_type:complete
MQSVKALFKQQNSTQLMIVVVLLIYILVDVKTPDSLAELIDNVYGQIVIILGALALFSNCHPLVGVLALFAAYQLIVRSSKATGTFAVDNVMPSEENKYEEMIEQNVIPQTLEEEVVKNMVPLVRDLPNGEQSYKPILDSNIDSSLL